MIKRSDRPHAKINGIDTAAAAKAPGVVAVFTGADMAADSIGGLPCGWQIHNKDGSPMAEPPHPVLAVGKVRHVGDPVAVVIAETKQAAKDAAELLAIDYQDLPAVATLQRRARSRAPRWCTTMSPATSATTGISATRRWWTASSPRRAKVVKLDLTNNRLIPNAMEPRAAIGEFDPSSGDFTLYTTSQNPHVIRLLMGAFVLHIPENKLRVVAPDVGGGFGSKIYHYAEEAIVTWAAGKVRRPVKWTAERNESFMSRRAWPRPCHAPPRWRWTRTAISWRCASRTLANMGAYLSTFAPCMPTYLYATLLAGVYKTPVIYCEVKAVFTNTVPVDAYRGAGRPEATFLLERLVDVDRARHRQGSRRAAAAEFHPGRRVPLPDAGRAAIRQRQLPGDAGCRAEGGRLRRLRSTPRGREGARQAARHRRFHLYRGLRHRALGRGRARSVRAPACMSAPTSGCIRPAASPSSPARTATARATKRPSRSSSSAQLGVPIDQVEVVHGDTAKIPFGMGTYGSRSLAVGGTAMVKAMDKIIAKGKKIAAHLMEASVDDIEFKDGKFTVAGTDKSKTLTDISLAAYVPHNYPIEELEPGLDETAFYDPKNFTFPGGCHVAEVEIDTDTGVVEVVNFVAVDDVGRVINPMIVEGQVQGGVAQGIGQALLETRGLRRGRATAVRLDDGLHHAARRRPAEHQGRHRDHAVHAQSARREGLRRGGRDRLAAGGHQRHRRRVEATTACGISTCRRRAQKIWSIIQAGAAEDGGGITRNSDDV